MTGKPGKGGQKGRSGRRKLPATVVKEAIESLSGDLPEIIERLKRLAFGDPIICQHCGKETGVTRPDREAAMYLLDRVLGKPKAQTELVGEVEISAVQLKRYQELADAAQQEYQTTVGEAATKLLGQQESYRGTPSSS